MKSSMRLKLIILLCFIGFVLWLWGINYPYVGMDNANNNYLSLAAKNYLRFGFVNLKFFPTYFAGERLPVPLPYYLHHPILIFPLSTIPFMIFGFHDWVVHITNLLFLLGDVFLIYKIGELVWNKKVGHWAAGLAMIFPMMSFFWKYIFFEQGSMFFNLLIFYYFLRYLRNHKKLYLFFIFLYSLLSGLLDWGVLYLLLPFLVFIVSLNKKTIKPIFLYIVASILSIGFFMLSVYFLRGEFGELRQAINVHAYTPQLFRLPYWPMRLVLITALRITIYFSPLSFLWLRGISKSRTLLFFFIFGCLNIIVFPTFTWENSYFLFYFIPFFAFSGALWLEKQEKRAIFIVATVLFLIVWSTAVNYFKIQQVKKQLWKYDAAVGINKSLMPYETVGVVNFPGDIFENYFFHPTRPMGLREVDAWRSGMLYPEINTLVISYDARSSEASLITKTSVLATPSLSPSLGGNTNRLLDLYRTVRDIFNVGSL